VSILLGRGLFAYLMVAAHRRARELKMNFDRLAGGVTFRKLGRDEKSNFFGIDVFYYAPVEQIKRSLVSIGSPLFKKKKKKDFGKTNTQIERISH